jgi:lauroyl/myristoyl acyltransferase
VGSAKWVRRTAQSTIARCIVALVSHLPLGGARWLGRALGRVANLVSPASVRRAREHLSLSLGATRSERSIRKISVSVLPTLCSQLCEILVLQRRGIERTLATVEIEGLDEFRRTCEAGLARGRGLIGVSAHYGNWELGAALFTRCCEGDAICVARRYEHEGYQLLLERLRGRLGVRVRSQEESLAPVLRLLKRGGALGLLPDQDFKQLHDGIFVEFLGRPAYTTTLPAELALRTGAAIVVATTHREGGRIRVDPSPLADPEEFRRLQDPVRALTEWWSRELERRIRAHPEQWVWLHRRWRTTPDRLGYRALRRREREARRRPAG